MSSINSIPISLTLALSTLLTLGQAPTWSGWRGSNRDGSAEQITPPDSWPKKLEQIWTEEVGDGYATPLVNDGRVYQHARQGEKEILLCLNLEDGKLLWKKEVPIKFTAGRGGEKHGLGRRPNATSGR